MDLPAISSSELISAGIGALAGAGLGAGTVAIATRKKRSKSRRRKSTKSTRRKSTRRHGRKLKFGSKAFRKKYLGHSKRKQKQPHTAGKRRDTSIRRIRYTKNNQPYVILANGRARFISKKSARTSKKRKGGKY